MAKDTINVCPLMGGKPCIEDGSYNEATKQIEGCMFWVTIQGKNPQDNTDIKNGGCAISWMPILMIENNNVGRGVAASVQSMRNEGVNTGDQITKALMDVAQKRIGK